MQKFIAIILIAFFAIGCTGSRGCGCPTWGYTPVEVHPDMPSMETAMEPHDFVWN